MWYNYFVEFEKKQKSRNRLVLGLFDLEGRRKTKIYLNAELRIPTRFLNEQESEVLEAEIARDEVLKEFKLEKKKFGKRFVYSIIMPHDLQIIKRLESPCFGKTIQKRFFQIGSYDKLIRFGGFFPDRVCSLSENLERRISEGEADAELEEIDFGKTISYSQFNQLPILFIDIEKPLWKHDDEKEFLDEREKLLKLENKYKRKKQCDEGEIQKHAERMERIVGLEEHLTKEFPIIGKVKLWEEKVDARVAFVTTIWQDGGKETKELFVYDPNSEIQTDSSNGYHILKFKTEHDLIENLIGKYHERNPIVCCGHNQVYDVTQIRFAAEKIGLIFDPAVSKVKPKRDFIEHFLQRLRQDMVYIDTLWDSNILKPHLKQRRFGTSLKLADVANSFGIDFEKSLSHEQLREVELSRLLGDSLDIRVRAAKKLLEYSCADLGKTREIFRRLPLELVFSVKGVLPFCTLSEIASFTNCMDKLHEKIYFEGYGNLLRINYAKKRRIDERQDFIRKFGAFKDKRLKQVGFSKQTGLHENVGEYYFSLEEALQEKIFQYCPSLKGVYDWTNSGQDDKKASQIRLGFLSYLKTFCVDLFLDYYLAKSASSDFINATKSRDFNKALSLNRTSGYRRWFFQNNYGFAFTELEKSIADSYKKLKQNLEGKASVVDFQGDYLFIKTLGGGVLNVPNLHQVRAFHKYECDPKKIAKDKQFVIKFD